MKKIITTTLGGLAVFAVFVGFVLPRKDSETAKREAQWDARYKRTEGYRAAAARRTKQDIDSWKEGGSWSGDEMPSREILARLTDGATTAEFSSAAAGSPVADPEGVEAFKEAYFNCLVEAWDADILNGDNITKRYVAGVMAAEAARKEAKKAAKKSSDEDSYRHGYVLAALPSGRLADSCKLGVTRRKSDPATSRSVQRRAWDVLQRLRAVLSEMGRNVEVPSPAQKYGIKPTSKQPSYAANLHSPTCHEPDYYYDRSDNQNNVN